MFKNLNPPPKKKEKSMQNCRKLVLYDNLLPNFVFCLFFLTKFFLKDWHYWCSFHFLCYMKELVKKNAKYRMEIFNITLLLQNPQSLKATTKLLKRKQQGMIYDRRKLKNTTFFLSNATIGCFFSSQKVSLYYS